MRSVARFAGVGAAAVAVALGGCAPPTPERISFRVPPRLSAVVAYLAADGGHFAAEGLDVELVSWDDSSSLIPALAQGDLDVSTSFRLDPAYLNVIARGGRVRYVAGGMVYAPGECGYSAFLARPGLLETGRLARPEGLRGLRLTSERTASNYYVWSRLLEQAGLEDDDVELVDVPGEARLEAMQQGRVDLTVTTEPRRSQLLRQGARLWRPVADVLPGHQSGFVVFGRRLLDERRDLGVRFLRAYRRAVAEYVAGGLSERLLAIAAARTRLAPEELREMCWPTYTPEIAVDRATFDEFQAWAARRGMIDEVMPLERLVDTELVAAARDDAR